MKTAGNGTGRLSAKALAIAVLWTLSFLAVYFADCNTVQAAAQGLSIGVIEEMEYKGYPLAPDPAVFLDGEVLERDTDYILTYSDNIEAGTGTIEISCTASDDYGKWQFIIKPADIGKAEIKLITDTDTQKTAVRAEYMGMVLTEGADFTAEYTVVGSAVTAAVKGVGNFSGSTEITAEAENIALFEQAEIELRSESEYIFSGKPVQLDCVLVVGGLRLIENEDYSVSYSDNTNSGTATMEFIGMGAYEGQSTQLSFTINPCSISECTVEIDSVEYTGREQKPVPVLKLGDYTLTEGVDFEVVGYENNIQSGTAEVVVNGKGNFKGKLTVKFEITPSTDPQTAVKARLDEMMEGKWDRKINDYVHTYVPGQYYNTLMTSPCTCHSYCNTGYESGCTCLIGRSTVLGNTGIQCAGFTFEVFEYLFGETNGAGENILTTYSRAENTWTQAALKKWITESFRSGDYFAYDNITYGYPHYVIVYEVDDEGIWVYEANYGGRCKINFRLLTFSEIYNQLDGLYHRTPCNYTLL